MDLLPITDLAIQQEDYEAVKTLLNYGFIVSTGQLELAAKTKENAIQLIKYNKENNGLDDSGNPTFYDDKYSKFDQIQQLLTQHYNANVINDINGFTNLRQGRNTTSAIVATIKSGEHIKVLDNTNPWYHVESMAGNEGYIYHSKIKSL